MAKKGETAVVDSIKKYILSIEPLAHIYKVYGSGFSKRGEPDLLCCIRGRFVGLEVKDAKNKSYGATELQLQRIKEIKDAGGIAAVVMSPEEVEVLLYESKIIQASERRFKISKEEKDSSIANGTGNGENPNSNKKIRTSSQTRQSKKNTNNKSRSRSSKLGTGIKNFLEE